MTLPDAYSEEPEAQLPEPEMSKRSRMVALGLCFFGGILGLHRFYVDKPRTAIAMIVTFGGMGVWYLYDLVLIAAGEFRDSEELPVRNWGVEESQYARRELTGRAERRVTELEEQFDGLRQQFNDLAERVDFAERMLAQQREPTPPKLPRGS
jgi:TM2 domain-containing membrane protein YozV